MAIPPIAWSDIEQICEGSFQRIGLDYKHMWSKIRKNPSGMLETKRQLGARVFKFVLNTQSNI